MAQNKDIVDSVFDMFDKAVDGGTEAIVKTGDRAICSGDNISRNADRLFDKILGVR